MGETLISIIVPVYNVEKYLRRCCDSILAQTYTNTEVILVDDGSTDSSSEICDEYANKDSRISVHHQKNGGLSAARNSGISLSKGEYITFIDSDDFIHPQMIECLYKGVSENDVYMSICGVRKVRVDDDAKGCKFNQSQSKLYSSVELLNLYYASDKNKLMVIAAWNKLYHRDLFIKCRFPEGRLYEDTYTSPRLIYAAERIYVNVSPLYFYFQRSDSIMKSNVSHKNIDDYVDAFGDMRLSMIEIGDEKLILRSSESIIRAAYIFVRSESVWRDKELCLYARKKYKNAYSQYISCVKSPFRRVLYTLMRYIPRTCNYVLKAKKYARREC